MTEYGKRLKRVVHRLGRYYAECARNIGISESSMTNQFNLEAPTPRVLKKICEATGVSADYFLGLIDEPLPYKRPKERSVI